MTEQPFSRVSIDRQEFEAFLDENQQLVERLEKLLEKVDALESLNKSLEERLRVTEQRTGFAEQKGTAGLQQADETLRKSRIIMARLLEETDRRLSEQRSSNP